MTVLKMEKKTTMTRPDDVIQTAVGRFGRWQFIICLSLSLTRGFAAWHHLSIVFEAPPVKFDCVDRPAGTQGLLGNPCLSYPTNVTLGDSQESTQGAENPGETLKWNKTYATDKLLKCQKWKYETSIFTNTIISEWDLVCDRGELTTLAQSIFMLGNLFGDVLFGILADRFGRKRPLIVAVVLLIVSGIASSFVPWFELLLALKFTTALALGGTMVTSFVLCMESVGGRWRMVVATLYHLPYGVGYSGMALIAFFVRDWRTFQLAISLPPLCMLVYCWIVPESARWLVAVGRIDKAVDIIKAAAQTNELPEPSEGLVRQLKEMGDSKGKEKKYNTCDLFRTRQLRKRTICLCYHWFVCGVCFFGLSQYIGRIGGDIFVNVAIAGLMQIPGKLVCLLTLDRYGRRLTLLFSFLLIGIGSLLLLAAVQEGWPQQLKSIFALCGIVGLSTALPTVYLYTTELYPTVIRNNGLGFTAMFSRVGSVLAPVAVSLGSVNGYLPPLCFGVMSMLAVAICWPLPETAHQSLPHSIDDVENQNMKSKQVSSRF